MHTNFFRLIFILNEKDNIICREDIVSALKDVEGVTFHSLLSDVVELDCMIDAPTKFNAMALCISQLETIIPNATFIGIK